MNPVLYLIHKITNKKEEIDHIPICADCEKNKATTEVIYPITRRVEFLCGRCVIFRMSRGSVVMVGEEIYDSEEYCARRYKT